jgi:hypothetical protein
MPYPPKPRSHLSAKKNDLEELKKSVLQKAFSGALTCGELVEPKTVSGILS